jgi:hypothetical protein
MSRHVLDVSEWIEQQGEQWRLSIGRAGGFVEQVPQTRKDVKECVNMLRGGLEFLSGQV